jgi:hypothetical protein
MKRQYVYALVLAFALSLVSPALAQGPLGAGAGSPSGPGMGLPPQFLPGLAPGTVRASRSADFAIVQLPGYVIVYNQPGARITVTLKGPSGNVKDTKSGTADSDGYIGFNFYMGNGISEIVPGDTLVVQAPNRTYEVAVVEISMLVDTQHNRVSGTGPAGQTLTFSFYQWPCWENREATVPVDASGRWQFDLSAWGRVVAGDGLRASYQEGANKVTLWDNAAGLEVRLGEGSIQGGTSGPWEPVSFTLRDSGHTLKAGGSLSSGSWGWFRAYLVNPTSGEPTSAQGGDELEADFGGQAFDLVLPAITGSWDHATGKVSGSAPPGVELYTRYLHYTGEYWRSGCSYGASDASGHYSIFAPGYYQFSPGDHVEVHYRDSGGSRVILPLYSTSVGLAGISVPTWVTPGQSVTASWQLAGDAVQDRRSYLGWGPGSHAVDGDYPYYAGSNTGDAYSASFVPPFSRGVVYLRLFAWGDEQSVASREYRVLVGMDATPVSAAIAAGGGTLVDSGLNIGTSLIFPAGAFASETTVTLTPEAPQSLPVGKSGIWHFFQLEAQQGGGAVSSTSVPYQLSVHYTAEDLGPAEEDTLALYYWDGSQWQREGSSTLDTASKTVTAMVNHFSLWAVLGDTHAVCIPLVRR